MFSGFSRQPENILCVNRAANQIKIIDFGLARRYVHMLLLVLSELGNNLKSITSLQQHIWPIMVSYCFWYKDLFMYGSFSQGHLLIWNVWSWVKKFCSDVFFGWKVERDLILTEHAHISISEQLKRTKRWWLFSGLLPPVLRGSSKESIRGHQRLLQYNPCYITF